MSFDNICIFFLFVLYLILVFCYLVLVLLDITYSIKMQFSTIFTFLSLTM